MSKLKANPEMDLFIFSDKNFEYYQHKTKKNTYYYCLNKANVYNWIPYSVIILILNNIIKRYNYVKEKLIKEGEE